MSENNDKLLERMDLDRTMPKELTDLLTHLKERAKWSLLSDRETCKNITEFIYNYWKGELVRKEERKDDEFTEVFREITSIYSIRDIDSGYYDENVADIMYQIEGFKMFAPLGNGSLLVLARMECQKCKQHFLALLTFSFYEHYFEGPVADRGFDTPLLEFPLTAIGYFEGSRAFVELLRLTHLAKWQTFGKSLLRTFTRKPVIDRLKRTGSYSEFFLAKDFPLDLGKEQAEYYWGLRMNRGEKPPHSLFETSEISKKGSRKK